VIHDLLIELLHPPAGGREIAMTVSGYKNFYLETIFSDTILGNCSLAPLETTL